MSHLSIITGLLITVPVIPGMFLVMMVAELYPAKDLDDYPIAPKVLMYSFYISILLGDVND